MKAAIIRSYQDGVEYGDFEEPVAKTGEVIVKVKAAALSRLVRAQASGKHYSSEDRFPFVPGVDGVGTLADGRRVYFAFPSAPFGSMVGTHGKRARKCFEHAIGGVYWRGFAGVHSGRIQDQR